MKFLKKITLVLMVGLICIGISANYGREIKMKEKQIARLSDKISHLKSKKNNLITKLHRARNAGNRQKATRLQKKIFSLQDQIDELSNGMQEKQQKVVKLRFSNSIQKQVNETISDLK